MPLPGPASILLWALPPNGGLSPVCAPLASEGQRGVICRGVKEVERAGKCRAERPYVCREPLVVQDNTGDGTRRGRAPDHSLHVRSPQTSRISGLCTNIVTLFLSNIGVMHKHHNTIIPFPFPCEADDETQGTKPILAGGLITASSLAVLYIDAALGEMC